MSKPRPPVRPLREKKLGTVGELSTSNPRTEVRGAGRAAPNVSAREADDVDMGDEVAQRGVSDAESIAGCEVREPRRRNSPSDPTSREIEDHVLKGLARFRSWCAACVQERVRGERHQGEGRKVRRSQSSRRITASLEPGSESEKVRWNSVGTNWP